METEDKPDDLQSTETPREFFLDSVFCLTTTLQEPVHSTLLSEDSKELVVGSRLVSAGGEK